VYRDALGEFSTERRNHLGVGPETRSQKRKREVEDPPREKRRKKSFRLVTLNTQGKKEGCVSGILSLQPDVLNLQECGSLTLKDKIGGYAVRGLHWTATPGGNGRCSMAMLFPGMTMNSGYPAVITSVVDKKRHIQCKERRGVLVANIHAGGKTYIGEAINLVRSRADNGKKPFIIAGDLNQEPAVVEKIIADKKLSGELHVIYPCQDNGKAKATRPASGRTLDYAISNRPGTARVVDGFIPSDHRAVEIDLDLSKQETIKGPE